MYRKPKMPSIIDDYVKTLSEPERAALDHIRSIVVQEVPDAQEVISYNLPAFKYNNGIILGFAANKKFLSLYPFSGQVTSDLAEELKGFDQTPGSIHFTPDNPIPDTTIQKIIQLRLQTIAKSK